MLWASFPVVWVKLPKNSLARKHQTTHFNTTKLNQPRNETAHKKVVKSATEKL